MLTQKLAQWLPSWLANRDAGEVEPPPPLIDPYLRPDLGLPICEPAAILQNLGPELRKLRLIAPTPNGSETDFEELYVKVIENLARYTQLLPASEGYHHGYQGGLINHSVDVASRALRVARDQHLRHVFTEDIERDRLPRWRYAAWLAGLLHDVGKVLHDVTVTAAEDAGKQWQPIIQDMLCWAEQTGTEKIACKWKQQRVHKRHEVVSPTLLQVLLTEQAKAFLASAPDDLYAELVIALSSYHQGEDYLRRALRIADSVSTGNDIRIIWDRELGPRKAQTYELLSKGFQRCYAHWNLSNHEHVVLLGNELHIAWPKAILEVVDILRAMNQSVPGDHKQIRQLLHERNIIMPHLNETSYSQYYPDIGTLDDAMQMLTGQVRHDFVPVYRIEWPQYVTGPHALPPDSYGLLKLNEAGDSLLFIKEDVVRITAEQVQQALEKLMEDGLVQSSPADTPPTTSESNQSTQEQPQSGANWRDITTPDLQITGANTQTVPWRPKKPPTDADSKLASLIMSKAYFQCPEGNLYLDAAVLTKQHKDEIANLTEAWRLDKLIAPKSTMPHLMVETVDLPDGVRKGIPLGPKLTCHNLQSLSSPQEGPADNQAVHSEPSPKAPPRCDASVSKMVTQSELSSSEQYMVIELAHVIATHLKDASEEQVASQLLSISDHIRDGMLYLDDKGHFNISFNMLQSHGSQQTALRQFLMDKEHGIPIKRINKGPNDRWFVFFPPGDPEPDQQPRDDSGKE